MKSFILLTIGFHRDCLLEENLKNESKIVNLLFYGS